MGKINEGWYPVYHSAWDILHENCKSWPKHTVYTNLARRANISGGTLSTTVSEIAREAGWSRGKVRRFLKDCEQGGLLGFSAKGQETDTPTDTLNLVFMRPAGRRRTPQRTGDGHPPEVPTRPRAPASSDLALKNKNTPYSPPEWLDEEAWAEWTQHRREIRKPITPTAANQQFKKLNQWREQGYDPAKIIRLAIERGWQGLIVPDYGAADLKQERQPGAPLTVVI